MVSARSAVAAPSSIDGSGVGGFPKDRWILFPHSPSQAWFDAAGNDPSSPVSWTEKRILWTEKEDLRLMSVWIEHSTDSTYGADKGGNRYWGEVVESYNKTTPPFRKRNLKQCKDRWHKINRWTNLFECAYVKVRRVFTSGYSDQMWIDAAHKFYVEDNKDAKLGPFVGIEVWKICREVSKWKTYNEELRNAHKLGKFGEETNANRMKILGCKKSYHPRSLIPQNLPTFIAQETKKGKMLEKESKMMEAYNMTSSYKIQVQCPMWKRRSEFFAMKCLRKALFPESN
ncbi:unnamed protein product [Miscanthus lutarioriparius]|uniref:Myb-like domain-containing protein n=1 Tax=Miscanthus lutarioriparius TaxID=422564 RepID=A0A811N040_9POAL|nr:unnamed protein product [Miscanthus lutarioriparius]